MKCKDCGETNQPMSPRASWICVSCFELRGKIVEAMKTMDADEFRELQRVIARGDGTGANAMRRVLGLDAPVL